MKSINIYNTDSSLNPAQFRLLHDKLSSVYMDTGFVNYCQVLRKVLNDNENMPIEWLNKIVDSNIDDIMQKEFDGIREKVLSEHFIEGIMK